MSILLAKKIYFDIFNLENNLKNKQQIIQDYQELFDEYILNYKDENQSFAAVFNELDDLNKKVIKKEFDKTISDIEEKINSTNTDEILNQETSIIHLDSIIKNYRDIVKLTHPDKTLNLPLDIQVKYTEHYKNATNYYDNNDLYNLMLINKLLGNNPFNITFIEEDINNLKNKKITLEKDIENIQESFIWNFMNINDEKELNTFISNHFKNMLEKMK